MKSKFTYKDMVFIGSAGYPPVCSEEEKDHEFHKTLAETGKLPNNIEKYYLNSWIVARLAYLTDGSILKTGNLFSSDGADFAYKFKVEAIDGSFIGKLGIVCYPSMIQFAGYSNDDRNMKAIFTELLLENVDDVLESEVIVECPDGDNREYRYGWNGYNYI